jgi:beta-fructofuranosidase
MKLRTLLLVTLTATSLSTTAQTTAAHFDMSLSNGQITESVSNTSYTIASQLPACTIASPSGDALRFDGYSNYVKAGLTASTISIETMTISVTLAAESYPMMKVDVAEETPTYATICGNLDETSKQGFSLELSSQGDLRARLYVDYSGGYMVTVDGSKKLPRGQWNMLTLTFDKSGNAINLYLNGEQIGNKRSNRCNLLLGTNDFYIGKDATDVKSGPFLINTFCGAIDEIAIYNEVISPSNYTTQIASFNYPAERYADNIWRPQFHGMPSGSWTNETHGMIYSGGRYHLFFQKNPNGPYMSRLHWGHISSENLYDWTEEPIAIAPGESYDIKGCWSGCVYEDGGDTYILYTAVDNAKATIAQAKAKDANLIEWEKQGVIINGRPSGLSDDFRDPYFFTANGQKYIIVGTSKNNIGACTLHKYENGAWTNDGSIFFQGGNANQHGTFWEMPNVTDMGNGKYLFTCTPLNTGVGVRTLCWVGTIGADGKFTPDGDMQYLEMGGISRDGYGLLSPTICQKDGKTLLLGIVPDKLATDENYKMGWAHNYSLPREINIAADGSLVQKPYSGLEGMREAEGMSGRQLELLGEFTVPNGTCGFHFLKAGDKQATLSYDPATGILTLDYTTLDRVTTDNGVWSAALPQKVAVGEKLKLHLFLDGSIVDIFVNDTWAFSTRIFPTDADAIAAEAFGNSNTDIKGWVLDASNTTGIGATLNDKVKITNNKFYDLQGRRLSAAPQNGLYILNGKKYVSR